MKINFLAFLVVTFASGLTGAGIMRVYSSIQLTQYRSSAGQTLVDLSRALESEKLKTGRYPDSIIDLKVDDSGGDFSSQILNDVIYYKTESGFIAFVGAPHVAYIYPGVSTQSK